MGHEGVELKKMNDDGVVLTTNYGNSCFFWLNPKP